MAYTVILGAHFVVESARQSKMRGGDSIAVSGNGNSEQGLGVNKSMHTKGWGWSVIDAAAAAA